MSGRGPTTTNSFRESEVFNERIYAPKKIFKNEDSISNIIESCRSRRSNILNEVVARARATQEKHGQHHA